MRLFVSIDCPPALTDAISGLQDRFHDADGLRLTDPTQAHVTLKFLGDVDDEQLPALEVAIGEAVTESEVDPFEATYEGLGVFPSLEYISVVWFGVGQGSVEMTRLHEAIEARTVDLGFEPEAHDFTPHVTLARMDHAGGKDLVQELVENEDPTLGTATVEEVRLTESELTRDGPEYSTVASFPLGE